MIGEWKRVRRYAPNIMQTWRNKYSVRLQVLEGQTKGPVLNQEEILLSADTLFRAEQSGDLRGLIAEKSENLRHYDVLAMERLVAICCWGRSGSVLLASYLDGHEDVIMLPSSSGELAYTFFERCQSLPLRDKLIAYPAFTQQYSPLFDGDFAIESSQYYAAVQAIVEVYGKWPAEFLASRRAFFLFLHIAYNLALGRRPASSHPLIVYAMHERLNVMARHLADDFPQARFIHTVRDPITLFDRMFDNWFSWFRALPPDAPLPTTVPAAATLHQIPVDVVNYLIKRDQPHLGMESRTRTVRFEDMHSDIAETMRDLADWLGIPFEATLLESTFNGIPYVVTRGGIAWSGQRLEQVQRSLGNLSRKDRALLFALFYENFAAWNYSCPKILGNPIVRWIVFVALVLMPMKMELTVAWLVFKRRILPSVRRGNISIVMESLSRIGVCRLAIIRLFTPDFIRRLGGRKTVLQIDDKRRRTKPAR